MRYQGLLDLRRWKKQGVISKSKKAGKNRSNTALNVKEKLQVVVVYSGSEGVRTNPSGVIRNGE